MNITTYDPSYSDRKRNQGFTLVELMVTIAISAIVVGIAAPNISTQLANQRVKSTAATLENALKEARAESVIRRQNIQVGYNNNNTASGRISVGNIRTYDYSSESKIKEESNQTSVTLRSNKTASSSMTYTVCDSNIHASPMQVLVNGLAIISTQVGGTCS